jgi:uncharacterized membrane protein YkvA (DUF1232 family)
MAKPRKAAMPPEAGVIEPGRALAPFLRRDERKQEERVRRDFWAALKRAGRRIPFAEDAVAAFYCATDARTPKSARMTLFAALAYFIAPFDLVPDMLALIGFGDDMAVLLGVVAVLKANLTDEHYEKARAALAEDAPDAPSGG